MVDAFTRSTRPSKTLPATFRKLNSLYASILIKFILVDRSLPLLTKFIVAHAFPFDADNL